MIDGKSIADAYDTGVLTLLGVMGVISVVCLIAAVFA